MAPGLFVLDENDAARASHVLDWAGRFHARKRLFALRTREPQVAGPPETGFGGWAGRKPEQLAQGAAREVQTGGGRNEKGRRGVSPRANDARLGREQYAAATARDGD